MQIRTYLTHLIEQALISLHIEIPAPIHLEHPADPAHGDYSTNVAMVMWGGRQAGGKTEKYITFTNPRQLAEAVTDQLNQLITQEELPVVSSVAVAGPGFINFTLSHQYLLEELVKITTGPDQVRQSEARVPGSSAITTSPTTEPTAAKKAVVEYSSPNIAKPFTIGHLRSTIIGDAIANLMEATGWTVYRDNHLGDWGTQFGKQIYALKAWGDEATLETSAQPVKDLVDLYVKFHQEAEQNPSLEDEGRAWFKKLEEGDAEARRLWHTCIELSLKEFKRIYALLDVKFTENNGIGYGESFFEDKMRPVIAELETKGLLTESEGAKLVFFPNDEYPPLMIVKKDGSTLYATRDLATDKFRLEKYGSDTVIINEVGAEQSLYFQQLFKVEELAGWYQAGQRVHVKHGMYRFKEGKMSTRKGNVIWLEDVLTEAFNRVKSQTTQALPDQDLWKIAIGAVKWNDLRRESAKDIAFDYDEIANIQGNSGPYLQYTYVRCHSILTKAGIAEGGSEVSKVNGSEKNISKYIDTVINNKEHLSQKLNQHEIDLLRNIYIYNEIVELAAREYAPHHLCTYLYHLAQLFNAFYNQHSVLAPELDEATRAFRIGLTQAVGIILKDGLKLLGIQTVEKM